MDTPGTGRVAGKWLFLDEEQVWNGQGGFWPVSRLEHVLMFGKSEFQLPEKQDFRRRVFPVFVQIPVGYPS